VTRSRATLTMYAALGCLGYLLNGLGAVLPQLREELALSRVEVALYPSGFALGLLAVGGFGDRLAHLLGRRALPTALAVLAAGALLLAAGHRVPSGAGALLLGLGGAGLVQLVPAGLRTEHGQRAAVAIGEANAVSSTASVLAPLLVGAAIAVDLGWRAGYLVVPLLGIAAVGATALRTVPAGDPPPNPRGDRGAGERGPDRRAPRRFAGRWVDVLLAVSVEFCLVFWAADDLRTQHGLGPGPAAAAAGLLLLGMATGRAASAAALRLLPVAARLIALVGGVAVAGFALLWAVSDPFVAAAGLFLAGLGIALLYPVSLAEALAAWPANPTRAAARCALASGVAIGAAPLLLGALADLVGLRAALLLVPALLGAIVVRSAARLATARVAAEGRGHGGRVRT
jgi:MFS family permease